MIVVYYSATTGRAFQRTLLSENEKPRSTRPGEGILQVDQKLFDQWLSSWGKDGAHDPIQEYVSSVTGLIPSNDTYAIVQGTNVVNIVVGADPALGQLDNEFASRPGALAIPSNTAKVGATYVNGVFTNPVDVSTKQSAGV